MSVVSHVRRASTTSLTFKLKDRISVDRDSGLPVNFRKPPGFFFPLDLPAHRDHASPHWHRFAIPEPSRRRTGAAAFSAGQSECAY